MLGFWCNVPFQASTIMTLTFITDTITTTGTITNPIATPLSDPWWVPHPDLPTAIITFLLSVVILPVLYFSGRLIRNSLKAGATHVIDIVIYHVAARFHHSLAATFTLKKYCSLLLKGSSQFLQVPSTHNISLEIDKVYVPLFADEKGGSQRAFTHQDLLSVGNRIVVAGDPGSGKSSLVKRLLRDTCKAALEKPRRSRLPIWIELRKLEIPGNIEDESLGSWLYEEFRRRVKEFRVLKMSEAFDAYSKSTGLLVLLDGLDEVATMRYPRVWKAIESLSEILANTSDKNTILLTMRTQFQQQIRGTYSDAFPISLYLKPFSPSDIYEFLSRWPFREHRARKITEIFNSLSDRPTLREMCSNPLVLSMYVAEVAASGEAIAPETRTDFYSKVTQELLVFRRSRQVGPAPARTTLREQRETILGILAHDHLLDPSQPANSLSWPKALEVVSDVVGCKLDQAQVVFDDLAKDTGLIMEERPGETFRFIHLTFAEYLAAFEAVRGRKGGWDGLVMAHKQFKSSPHEQLHGRLIEVLPFATGLLARPDRVTAMRDVLEIDDWRLTARVFLETKLYSDAGWPDFVRSTHDLLLSQPETEWDSDWLRSLHLFNTVVTDAEQSAAHVRSAELAVNLESFYRSLLAIQKHSMEKLLTSYASQDAAAAFRLAQLTGLELVNTFPDVIVSNLDQKPFFGLIVQQALDDTEFEPRLGQRFLLKADYVPGRSQRGLWISLQALRGRNSY